MIDAGYFDTPVVNIGIRQEGRETDSGIIHVKPSKNEIVKAIQKCFRKKITRKKKNLYGDGNASKKIIKQLETVKLNKELIKKQIYY